MSIKFAPKDEIHPGVDAPGVRQAADASLDAAYSKFKTDMEATMHQERRLSYE